MKYSLIITAWKEPETVKENLKLVLDPSYNNNLSDLEIIIACPDEETIIAAKETVQKYNFKNLVHVKDLQEGKPAALNLAINTSKGKILIFTDGDVVIDSDCLPNLISKFENDIELGIVTGRPISADSKSNMFGYFGNLLADAAHEKRKAKFSKGNFYFVSGYLYAVRKINILHFPEDLLVDDAWVTLKYVEEGYKVGYAPEAKVKVKYPKNLKDWIKQKKRSIGGYNDIKFQSEKFNVERNIKEELKFVFFPLTYFSNSKELFFSLALYPIRLWLWLIIFWERYINKKSFREQWVRVESTK